MNRRSSYETLPSYLKKYCSFQNYDQYTAADHAAWRYIMRQSRAYFKDHALPIYEEGLVKTGISTSRIPRIEEMDAALNQFGWGAVAVNGFIPPAVFLEFQAHQILAIATDMRTLDHIAYTPAPDIVHESAGHAPIVADEDYRTYLTEYAQMANKAIISSEDIAVYEAIRRLSDVKENPDKSAQDILEAEENLKRASLAISYDSELTKVSRMAWWTVEYGLMGDAHKPDTLKIFGAGLLSSVGESKQCLSAAVKKVPFSIDCIHQGYDITEHQPQLFVAQDVEHLRSELKSLEDQLSFKNGGLTGLHEACRAQNITTTHIDTGLAISSQVVSYEGHNNNPVFASYGSPYQLTFQSKALSFSAPKDSQVCLCLGRFQGRSDLHPQALSDKDLNDIGCTINRRSSVSFAQSGLTIEGTPHSFYRENGRLLYIEWSECTIKFQNKTLSHSPSLILAVGEKIPSVHGGPVLWDDFEAYHVGQMSTSPGRSSPYTEEEKKSFGFFQKLRDLRSDNTSTPSLAEIDQMAQEALEKFPHIWLIGLEALELASQSGVDLTLQEKNGGEHKNIFRLYKHLEDGGTQWKTEDASLIREGLNLLSSDTDAA